MKIRVILKPRVLRLSRCDIRALRFERWKGLVTRIALDIAKRWNRPASEVIEEAYSHLAFKVCAKWDIDPSKGATSTWIYQCAYWHLWIWCEKNARARGVGLLPEEADRPARGSWFHALLTELGDEARVLVLALVEAPGELAGTVSHRAPTRSRRAVRRYLEKTEGWNPYQFERVWGEVERCVLS